MKNKIFSLIASAALCLPMFASMNMYVKQKDGKIVAFDVETVEEVYYGVGDSPVVETPGDDPVIDDPVVEEPQINIYSEIVVEKGGTYYAYNHSIPGGELQFEVLSVSGTAGSKVVRFMVHLKGDEADGKIFEIGDDADHCSYFGRINGQLQACRQVVAVYNAQNVIFALSSEASNYLITSATVNYGVREAGATRTEFGVEEGIKTETPKDDPVVEEPQINIYSEIVVEKGGTYYAYNPSIPGGELQFEVLSVSGTAGTKVVRFMVHLKGDEADGKIFEIGDDADHASYFGYVDGQFQACKQVVAVRNAKDVIFALPSSASNYLITSATVNNSVREAGALETKFGVIEKIKTETPSDPVDGQTQIQVVAGGIYTATNAANGTFTFKVKSVSGSYLEKNQLVVIEIDGKEFYLADYDCSYLMWNDGYFTTVNTIYAKKEPERVVLCLASANSSANYTIASPTTNTTLKELGAVATYFSTSDSSEDTPVDWENAPTSITAVAGDQYLVYNAKLDMEGELLTIISVEGSTVTFAINGSVVTIGSASADKSYSIFTTDGEAVAGSMQDAIKSAKRVLLICKSGSVLASGSTALNADIYPYAGKTTFVKK